MGYREICPLRDGGVHRGVYNLFTQQSSISRLYQRVDQSTFDIVATAFINA